MSIDASLIAKLRASSGAGMMDCKNALEEAGGDFEKAGDLLREKGIVKAAKRADKIAAEGTTLVKTDTNSAVILELNSETDFVAKNEDFKNLTTQLAESLLKNKPENLESALSVKLENGETIETTINNLSGKIGEKITLRRFEVAIKNDGENFGGYIHMGGKISVLVVLKGGSEEIAKDVAMHAAASSPKYTKRDEVNPEEIEREKAIYSEQLKNEGKPENIIEKIVEGKLNKFYSEICLLEQSFIKDEDKKVEQFLKDNNAELVKFIRFELGDGIEKKDCDFAAEVAEQIGE